MLQRYFIYLAYNGSRYCGWQIQPNGESVQAVLAYALSTILREPIEVVGAGRTDAGVHARCMVAHFDTEVVLAENITARLNSFLPVDITISRIVNANIDSHARFSAISRCYEYLVIQHKDPFLHNLACRMHQPLDFNAMNKAAKHLFEYQDFTSFSKTHTDVKTNLCTITEAYWEQRGEVWVFTIRANRFLRNMVRAIVGTLFEVGLGRLTEKEFCEIIEAKNRSKAGLSVPACGLYLTDVTYPESVFQSDSTF